MSRRPSWQLRLFRVYTRGVALYFTVMFLPLIACDVRGVKWLFRACMNAMERVAGIIYRTLHRHKQVRMTEAKIAGVKVVWFTPPNLREPKKIVLYVHGGFWFACSEMTHYPVLSTLACRLGCRVLYVDYGRAPENHFPVAMHQICDVYRQLLADQNAPHDIVVGGDSAGGSLTVGFLMRTRDAGLPLPAGAFLESPALDLSLSAPSISENWRTECVLPSLGGLTRFFGRILLKRHYAGQYASDDPLASPLFGACHGLPPIYLAYSRQEILRDDAVRFAAKVRAAGGVVREQAMDGMPHASVIFHGAFPEADEALQGTTAFIADVLELRKS